MAVLPQNSIRAGLPGDVRPEPANRALMPPKASATASIRPPCRLQFQPGVSEIGGSRRIRCVSAWFRPDSRLFVKKAGLFECHGSAFALLHSRSAFGIALPLSASDRRQLGCGCSSVVEHDLAKVGVEGSSPFARSKIFSIGT